MFQRLLFVHRTSTRIRKAAALKHILCQPKGKQILKYFLTFIFLISVKMLHAVVSVLATAGQCPSLSFCLTTLRPLPLSPPPPPPLSPPPPSRRPFPSHSDDQLSARKRRRTAGKSLLKVMQPTALVGSSDGSGILVITVEADSNGESVLTKVHHHRILHVSEQTPLLAAAQAGADCASAPKSENAAIQAVAPEWTAESVTKRAPANSGQKVEEEVFTVSLASQDLCTEVVI
jgi:hypothetical protein